MRICAIIFCLLLYSCDECDESQKNWSTQLSCVERRTFYDWDKIVRPKGDEIYFGIGVVYYQQCLPGKAQEELNIHLSKFYLNRSVVMNKDTIPEYTDMLYSIHLQHLLTLYKDVDAFFNYPQYLIKVNNSSKFLLGDYVCYFEGVTNSGHHFKDSSIVSVQ